MAIRHTTYDVSTSSPPPLPWTKSHGTRTAQGWKTSDGTPTHPVAPSLRNASRPDKPIRQQRWGVKGHGNFFKHPLDHLAWQFQDSWEREKLEEIGKAINL